MTLCTSVAQFTYFIAIDYSARNKPSPAKPTADAIWLAEATATGEVESTYFRTRHACHKYVEKRLIDLRHERVLVGWDFSFGYPRGTAQALGLKTRPAYRAIWELLAQIVEDAPNNTNNRFSVGARLNRQIRAPAGPFWGSVRSESGIFLGAKKDFTYPVSTKIGMLPERRYVETFHKKMQPAWKLAYIGSVGSQSLIGIPRVLALRDHEQLREVSRVWPFETSGVGADGDKGGDVRAGRAGAIILHAEIYPGLITLVGSDAIKDREQVITYVQWLQAQQRSGRLTALLDRPWGDDLTIHQQVTEHEGWVLGVSQPLDASRASDG